MGLICTSNLFLSSIILSHLVTKALNPVKCLISHRNNISRTGSAVGLETKSSLAACGLSGNDLVLVLIGRAGAGERDAVQRHPGTFIGAVVGIAQLVRHILGIAKAVDHKTLESRIGNNNRIIGKVEEAVLGQVGIDDKLEGDVHEIGIGQAVIVRLTRAQAGNDAQ